MSVVTANILIGESHPYDLGIIPTHCLFLWEGHVARWTIFSVREADYLSFPVPEAPEMIVPQLNQILRRYKPEIVVATVLPNSSIEGHLDSMFESANFSAVVNEINNLKVSNSFSERANHFDQPSPP